MEHSRIEDFLERAELICDGLYACDNTPVKHLRIPELLYFPVPVGYFCDLHESLIHAVATEIEGETTVPFIAALTKAELQGEFSQLKPKGNCKSLICK